MSDFLIAASILAANFARLGEEVDAVLAAGADMIHFDVMDNHYVPNLTVGPLVCEALRGHGVTAPIDVHLMVRPVDRSIGLIRELGCRPGLALNPATPLSWLDYTLEKLDLVLVMSVNPGFGGQAFIPQTIRKLQAVRQLVDAQAGEIRVEVDGGIKSDNIAAVAAAGADTFVSGSAIFGSGDYVAVIGRMRDELAAATGSAAAAAV